jgi:ribose transport system substrate-binding protein
MRNILKRTFYVMLGITTIFLVSCTQERAGESGAGKDDTLRVAFSQCQSSDPWRIAETNDIMRAAKEKGFDLIYTDAQGDTSKQISDVEDICAQGVDYLIFDGREFEASAAALDIAKKAGAKVILIDRLVRGQAGVDYITYIGTDFIWEGQAAAEWVVKNTNGKARIIEITGTPGSSAADDRQKGFLSGISGQNGMEIIISQTADFSRSQAQQVVENAIQSTRGQFDVIFAHNDEMGMGAIQALKSAGIQPGKDVLVVSIDGQQDAVRAVIAGELGCTVTCNPLYGDITFETLEKIINGEKVPEQIILQDIVIDSSNAEERLPFAH